MSPKTAAIYQNWLKEDFDRLIESLDLNEVQKHALRSRWLDRVLYAEHRSANARVKYFTLRLTTIVGGVIVPALVSLNLSGAVGTSLSWLVFGVSLLIAVSAAVEEFFHYGERWRHYRRGAEWLKIEGWQFFQLSGRYRRSKTHAAAYPAFAARVEGAIHRDVQEYITEVTQEPQAPEARTPQPRPIGS
jgi:hypothetical protein